MGLQTNRKASYKISPIILHRWSPRAMSSAAMSDEELLPLFEAARWAPSSYNNQPWRFVIAKRDTPEWKKLFDLMVEFNQSWTKDASCLIVVISKKTFDHDGKPMQTHSFDTGSAWQNLALEAASRGYVAHGMQGFDYEKAKKVLKIPDDHAVEAMVAIGKLGKKESLPQQLQEREAPSDRKPLNELIFHGEFGKKYLE